MADHRAEVIIKAIHDKLLSLETTGGSVTRAQNIVWDDSELPALTIAMGSDYPVEGSANIVVVTHRMSVTFTSHVREFSHEPADKTLTDIRGDVAVALLADHTIGLDFVIDIIEGGADTPDYSQLGDRQLVSQNFTYDVIYRRARTNPFDN